MPLKRKPNGFSKAPQNNFKRVRLPDEMYQQMGIKAPVRPSAATSDGNRPGSRIDSRPDLRLPRDQRATQQAANIKEKAKKRDKKLKSSVDVTKNSHKREQFNDLDMDENTGPDLDEGNKTDPELDVEAQEIKYLEFMLGKSEGREKDENGQEIEDGLEDLLEGADLILSGGSFAGKCKRGKELSFMSSDSEGSQEDEDSDVQIGGMSSYSEEDSEPEWMKKPLNPMHKAAAISMKNESSIGLASEASTSAKKLEDMPSVSVTPAEPQTGKFVPRHLGSKVEVDSNSQLTRLMKSQFNKLSPTNMGVIIQSLYGLYNSYPRANVTQTLVKLVMEHLISPDRITATHCLVSATLCAAMHRLVGLDFTAVLLENLIDFLYPLSSSVEPVTPQQDTLQFLSYAFLLDIVPASFIWDIVRTLLELKQAGVEGLLMVFRYAGRKLRAQDPSGLKEVVKIIQQDDQLVNPAVATLRTRFMVESLNDLKNNKLKHASLPALEPIENSHKYLNSLAKSNTIKTSDPIRASLEDLMNAQTRGRWWAVGAAWKGDPLVDAAKASGNMTSGAAKKSEAEAEKLARAQGMNTDIRRSIFCALILADDYTDAVERLKNLTLSDSQRREIIRVLLHCAGNEKTYNPYYMLVLGQVLSDSEDGKSAGITLQYSLWDLLREMGETSVAGRSTTKLSSGAGVDKRKCQNTARMVGWCLGRNYINLSIFKAVNFESVNPLAQSFFMLMIAYALISTQTASPVSILAKGHKMDRQKIGSIFVCLAQYPELARGLKHHLQKSSGQSEQDFLIRHFKKREFGFVNEARLEAIDIIELFIHKT